MKIAAKEPMPSAASLNLAFILGQQLWCHLETLKTLSMQSMHSFEHYFLSK